MISKKIEISPTVHGDITIPIEPLVTNVLTFIDTHLPLFSFHMQNGETPITSEKLLNQQLVDFFNGHSSDNNFGEYIKYKFIFRKDDERHDTLARPDIGITIWNKILSKSDLNSFFQIECKRLPTPNLSKDRVETEYVRGTRKNKGAIERFKKKEHGFHINEAAIIGYVQDNSIDFWQQKIFDWINVEISNPNNDLQWSSDDHLTVIKKGSLLHKYYSTCCRQGSPSIKLHHYLVKMYQ